MISPNTKTTIATLIATVGCTVGIVLYMERRFTSAERMVERVDERVARIEVILEDRVSFTAFDWWTRVLQARNPTLIVPEPRK